MENKRPSEPLELERWERMENEIKHLKRQTSWLTVALILQSITIFRNVLRINRISDVVMHLSELTDSMVSFHETVVRCFEEIARIIC